MHPQPSSSLQSSQASGRRSGSGAWNTPISLTENSSQQFGFDLKDAAHRYPRLARDAMRVTIGPMPVTRFLAEFLSDISEPLSKMPPSLNAFSGISHAAKESDIYEPLIRALNADNLSRGKIGSMKPDILCYADRHLSDAEKTGSDPTSRTHMGFAATFIEVKAKDSMDHYRDPPPGEKDRNGWVFVVGDRSSGGHGDGSDDAVHALGQNSAYAVDTQARQHRVFCFSVSISGYSARLIRWDRTGIIVSESFNLLSEPQFLCPAD
ncbi:hypothetical protein C8Q78DRAFT_991673 [Trametes maxima]|nr:hypothetical protein C8Q78DRAFT_991673 [Trametes maxima]